MNDFEQLHEETLYQGHIFDLTRVTLSLPDSKEHAYDVIKHRGAVTILPVDEAGRVHFVRQYRVGAGKHILELPAGLFESGESLEEAAHREVQEEIGMAAGKLELLGSFYLTPGYSTEKIHAFLATELYKSVLPADDDEFLEQVTLTIAEVFEMVKRGDIDDGKTLAVLLLAQNKLKG